MPRLCTVLFHTPLYNEPAADTPTLQLPPGDEIDFPPSSITSTSELLRSGMFNDLLHNTQLAFSNSG